VPRMRFLFGSPQVSCGVGLMHTLHHERRVMFVNSRHQRSVWWVLLVGVFLNCRPPSTAAARASAPPGPALIAEGSLVLFDTLAGGTSRDVRRFRFGLPVEIRGRTFQFAADHGATTTMVTDSTIEAVRLPHRFAHATRVDTLVRRAGVEPRLDSTANFVVIRGDSTFEYWGSFDRWVIDSLRVAGSLQEQVFIASEPVASSLRPFDGLLGRDVLSQFDLEFNLPERTLRLYARSGSGSDQNPRWLPRGMTAADCVPANSIRHMGLDTAGMSSADSADIRTNPGKRIWDQEELQLPLVINGRSIAGTFDSGGGETIMNWAAARALGLDRASPTVTATTTGSVVLFSFRPPLLAAPLDTMSYRATGITMELVRSTLPADTILISDPAFATFSNADDVKTNPMILVGLQHFRNDVLFLSYSTRKVCVSSKRP
jgi:hypothetical protein